MKLKTFFVIATAITVFAACGNIPDKGNDNQKGKTNDETKLTGDKTVYGLACDGCTDSVILLLPNDGSDPVKYDVIDAFRSHKIIGKLSVGDWIGLVLNKHDKQVADMVIDLDELKGTWCYQVMPKMRDRAGMSKRMQRRMMAHMPDSMMQTFMIPREYGFTLKRHWTASSVGHVQSQNSLEEESPVVYPAVKNYSAWHIWNGKLVLTKSKMKMGKNNEITFTPIGNDTADFVFMRKDSLRLRFKNVEVGFSRKADNVDVNKKANNIAAQQSKKALEETK